MVICLKNLMKVKAGEGILIWNMILQKRTFLNSGNWYIEICVICFLLKSEMDLMTSFLCISKRGQ